MLVFLVGLLVFVGVVLGVRHMCYWYLVLLVLLLRLLSSDVAAGSGW